MNILIIMPEDSLNGAEQYLKMVANYFHEDKVSIYFFKNTYTGKWDDVLKEHDVHFMSPDGHLKGMLKFINHIRKSNEKFDYIFTSHVYTNSLVGILLSIGLLKAQRFIARESTAIFLRFKGFKLYTYKFAYFLGYRKMDLLICQTQLMYDQLIKYFPIIQKRTKVMVLPNPVNLSGSDKMALELLPADFPDKFIVSAGRLIEEKGYDILIEAFSRLKKDHPELKLVILGEGKARPGLEELILNLNLKNEVLLTGYVKNVYNYFQKAQACIVSSRIEGFPNVLLQMMSQNTNVVSTLCAGGIETIPDIYTCPTENEEALRNAIERCLKGDNSANRQAFDNYLKPRYLEHFMMKIHDLIT
ncbi:MAG: glycosyltransferase [Gelidibacter sp.]